MSAPDPSKMSATQFFSIRILLMGDPDQADRDQALFLIERFANEHAEKVARRRAVAELKKFTGRTCNFCLADQGTGLYPYLAGGFHPNESGGGKFICTDRDIQDRIAAIEAEEGS